MSDEKKVDAALVTRGSTAVNFNDPVSLYMNESVFNQLQRVGKMLSHSQLVPVHLQSVWDDKGNLVTDRTADCALVVSQAFRWKMDPFAVAQCTFVLSGKLGYEGKLIAAVINASPRVSRSLNFKYSGEGENRSVIVSGRLKGEDEDRTIEGSWRQWQQQRNSKWREMTDQMLAYRGAREWARRHMPEAILGISSIDEVEEIVAAEAEVIPPDTTLNDLIAEATSAENDPPNREPVKVNEETGEVLVDAPLTTETDAQADAVEDAIEVTKEDAPKKRGRPKGSKSKPKEDKKDDVDPEDSEMADLFSD